MTKKIEAYELIQAVENIRANLPEILDMQTMMAEIRKKSFDEHVKKGFTAEQALQLCKQPLF